MMSKICGHRGAVNYKPENTMSGFEWCVNNNIEWAECDVQLTDENILLIIHDDTLERTSDTNGLVRKITKKQLETINVGVSNSKEKNFQKIPTLEELLKFCKSSGLKLNIEMKFYDPIKLSYRKRLVNELLKTIKKYKSNNQVLITSFDINALEILRKKSNDIPIGILYENLPKNWTNSATDLKVSSIHLDYNFLTLENLHQINDLNIKSFVYTCNNPSEIKLFWDAGLSGVITDDPLRFK
jgi:glycerophosphoryl diester phosphodiesterase